MPLTAHQTTDFNRGVDVFFNAPLGNSITEMIPSPEEYNKCGTGKKKAAHFHEQPPKA
jgi:hypothetical protein